MSSAATAEVVHDGTLGFRGALPGPDFAIEARLGQQTGNNLFHSFETFNLNHNESATFFGPDSVKNIISRVTGGSASSIDGLLRSKIPDADMYFLNPAGIMFGENARLDVQGSLYISTADYLRLGKEGRFNASHPNNSLLTVAPPSAFGFLDETPAGISKQYSFLAVPDGKTLSLIGGDITLQDKLIDRKTSMLSAPDGRINLVGVASSGEVLLEPAEMSDNAFERFGTISITDTTRGADNLAISGRSANVDVSGTGGGEIYIMGGQVVLDNGYVFADTLGNKDGKGITVKATDELVLAKGARITAETAETGNAGTITVTAGQIRLTDGAQIASTSRTSGAAGNIILSANNTIEISGQFSVSIDGEPVNFNSGILSNTINRGKGGHVTVSASTLTVKENGVIRADTKGLGDAGNISLQVDKLILDKGGQINLSAGHQTAITGTGRGGTLTVEAKEAILIKGYSSKTRPSGLLSNVFAAGQGGTIVVSAPLLEIQDNGTIQAGTRGDGNAGYISLDVGTLHIQQGGLIITNTARGKGHAGDIKINARNAIMIADSNPQALASLSSSTSGRGDAGQITITTPHLTLHRGGQIKNTTVGSGKGSTITINANEFHLKNGAEINASTFGTSQGGNVTIKAYHIDLADSTITAESGSRGNAGRVNLCVENSLRMRNSSIKTETVSSDGGDITITSPGYLYLINGAITTSVKAKDGNGGNITLTPEFIVLDNSQIIAQAVSGDGGNININTRKLYKFSESPINASSKFGLDGIVTINSPDVDISGDFLVLPKHFLDAAALLNNRCASISPQNSSSFTITVRDVLPPTPEDLR